MSITTTGRRIGRSSRATRAGDIAGDDFGGNPAPMLDASVQDHLGAQLRELYGAFSGERLPRVLLDLIAKLEATVPEPGGGPATAFRDDLLATLPALRGFALSLVAPAQADDLVQETLLKAWQNQHRFEPGSNLKAWLFTILRNLLYSQHRKRRREVEDVDGIAASQMVALPNQEHTVMLEKVALHLRKLPVGQREALVLVGGQGMTYEDAAAVLGCEVGTVKSRVSRSRATLTSALGLADRQLVSAQP